MIQKIDGFLDMGSLLGESKAPAVGLALRMEAKRHPETDPVLAEIHDEQLHVYLPEQEPAHYSLKQAKKVLPKLVEFILESK